MSEIREIPAVPAVHFPRNAVTVTRMFEIAQRNVIDYDATRYI